MGSPSWIIRPYEKRDRKAIRHICCETGFLGKPVDPLFEDRELFADYLTRYYTDYESDVSWVVEAEGEVKGYVLGARHTKRQEVFDRWHNLWLALRGGWRYFTRYGEPSRKFVKWILFEARHEIPVTPPESAHLHVNLLPEWRSINVTRHLMDRFIHRLSEVGCKRVYGQMVVFEKRRGDLFFARYGFRVLDVKEVTKYRDLTTDKVYLFTVQKELGEGKGLYGQDLREEIRQEKNENQETKAV